MVQIRTNKIIAAFILLTIVSFNSFGQSDFLKKFDFDLSYATVDTWRRVLAVDPIVIEDDDGKAFGISANFHLSEKVFFQFTYRRAELYNVDLASNFRLGLLGLNVGRKFMIGENFQLNLKAGMSIHNSPVYTTTQTNGFVNGQLVDVGPIIRDLNGVVGFLFFTGGAELLYNLTPEIDVGAGGEINFYSASGSTISFLFLKVKLFQ